MYIHEQDLCTKFSEKVNQHTSIYATELNIIIEDNMYNHFGCSACADIRSGSPYDASTVYRTIQ